MFNKDYYLNLLSKISYKKHLVITFFLSLTLFFSLFIFNLKFNNNISNFISKNSTILYNYVFTEKSFSSTDYIKISIEPKNNLFSQNIIKLIKQLTTDLKKIDIKILEKDLNKIYNDTNSNFIAEYFAHIIEINLDKKPNELKQILYDELLNTEKLYSFIFLKNKYFSFKEAQNIVSIFKKNNKKLLNIASNYSNYIDINENRRFKTISAVNSFLNFPYPVYNLLNEDLIFNSLSKIGLNKELISSFIYYTQITKIDKINKIDNFFFKKIGFKDSDLNLLTKNEALINDIIYNILNQTVVLETKKILSPNFSKNDIIWLNLIVINNDYLKNLYFSKNLDQTIINIIPYPLILNNYKNKTYNEISNILNDYRWKYPNIVFNETGDPVLTNLLKESVFNNIKLIFIIFVFIVLIISLISIKKVNPIIFYFIVTCSSIACTFGLMSLIQYELNYLSALIVPYTLTINLILSFYFYEIFNNNKNVFNYIKKLPISALLFICIALFIPSLFIESKIPKTFFTLLSINTFFSLLINTTIIPAYIRMTGFTYYNFNYTFNNSLNINKKYLIFILVLITILLLPGFTKIKIKFDNNNTFIKNHSSTIITSNFSENFYGSELLTISIIDNKIDFLDFNNIKYFNIIKNKLLNISGVDKVFSLYDIDYFNIYPEEYINTYLTNNKLRILVYLKQGTSFENVYKNINLLLNKSKYRDNIIISGKILLKNKILNQTSINLILALFIIFILLFLFQIYINKNILKVLKIFFPALFSIYILIASLSYLNYHLEIISLISFIFILIISYIFEIKNRLSILTFLTPFLFLCFLISDFIPFIKFGFLMFLGLLSSSFLSLLIKKN